MREWFTDIAEDIIHRNPQGLTAVQVAEDALEIAKARRIPPLSTAKNPIQSLASTLHWQWKIRRLPSINRRKGSRGVYIYCPCPPPAELTTAAVGIY